MLIYGFDPICGWCYGAVPAVRALRAAMPDLPIQLVMSGLVTGERVGPYAEMEGYIRGASENLKRVTGRAPSDTFFDLIRTPGVQGNSAPPSVAIDAVKCERPEAALPFAHAVIEAHFRDGADLNDPATYSPLLAEHAPGVTLPDLTDPTLAEAAWAEGREIGIRSFPTFAVVRGGRAEVLPTLYDPDALIAAVRTKAAA